MINRRFIIRVLREYVCSLPPDSSYARSKKVCPFLATKFSALSDRPVCSTNGNRRNEEHYSGGWKTPLITSRRAVRYPPDLPLPRLVVCGSPKLPSHFLSEDRRDYAWTGALLLLLYFVCCFALARNGIRRKEGREIKRKRTTRRRESLSGRF